MRLQSILLVLILMFNCASGMMGSPTSEGNGHGDPIISERSDEAVTFTNVSSQVGLPMIDSGHATFAWGDYNNDDQVDLLIDTVHGPLLYENNGPPNWDFNNVTSTVGLLGPGMANSVWGDYDNDGNLDIYSTWWEESVPSYDDVLWHNSGPPGYTFTNVTVAAGNVSDIYPGKGSVWADVDRDGYLDMYVVNWRTGSQPLYKDYFWHNNGNGTFTDMSQSAGIYDTDPPAYRSPPFAGMGVTSGDYNNDGWMDIYVSNYLISPNYLWNNQRNLTFKNVAIEKNAAGLNKTYHYGHSAGSAFADYNNDGFMDIWVSNLAHKDPGRADLCDNAQLLENQGPPWWNFTDMRKSTGIPITPKGTTEGIYYKDELYFSANWADMDNDGDIDLFVPQVKNNDWAHTYMWRNDGDGTFTNVTDSTTVKTYDSINGAWADYNNDGYMDIVVDGKYPFTGGARQVRLFKNNGNSNNWVEFRLQGTQNNAPGIGSRVKVTIGNNIQIRDVDGGSGSHGSQNSQFIHFGLGTSTTIDEVEVRWPDGNTQIMTNLLADQIYDIVEDTSGPSISSIQASKGVVQEDEEVTITATVSGAASTYQWDFSGDGTWDNVQGTTTVKHTYTEAGTYYPALRVLDASGQVGDFQTVPVLVENVIPAPTMQITGDPWEDSQLLFDVSGSTDTPSDLPYLEYNISYGDGLYTGWSTDPTASHSYSNSGTYDITLYVRDDDADVGDLVISQGVLNVPPAAMAVTNISGLEDEPIDLEASANDTPSDMVSLEYMWDTGDGYISPWSNETNITHTYSDSGSFNASFRVRDDDGAEDMINVTVLVKGVRPIAIIGDLLEVVNEDMLVEYSGSVVDTVSDTTFEYKWDFGDGISTSWSDAPDASHIYTKSGNLTVTFSVMDDDGLVGNDSKDIIVLNLPPLATIVEYPQDILEDEAGNFLGGGYDTPSDMPNLSYRWDFGDGNLSEWGNKTTLTHSYTQEGDYLIRFQVRDPEGQVAFVGETVTVTNVLPDCDVQVSSDNVLEDENVTIKAACKDTASDAKLDISWESATSKYQGDEIQLSFDKAGEHSIVLTASDDEGGKYIEKISIRVRNQGPRIVDIDYPSNISIGKAAHFEVNATDTPSDLSRIEYSWSFGDGSQGKGSSIDHIYNREGTMTVRLTVMDDDGIMVSKDVKILVEGEPKKPAPRSDGNDSTVLMAGGIGGGIIVALLILVYLFVIRPRNGGSEQEVFGSPTYRAPEDKDGKIGDQPHEKGNDVAEDRHGGDDVEEDRHGGDDVEKDPANRDIGK